MEFVAFAVPRELMENPALGIRQTAASAAQFGGWVGSERVYSGGEHCRGERGVDRQGIQQVGHFKLPYQS